MYLIYRKAVLVGGTVAVIVGLGGTALAVSGSDTVTTANTAGTANGKAHSQNEDGAKHGKHGGRNKLQKRLEHGQFVTKGKDGAVTHTIYRGSVTAVSTTSITVQAADKKSQTYSVTKDTKIRQRTKGSKPADSTIAKIAKGDQVVVAGTGTSTVTAKNIVEFAK